MNKIYINYVVKSIRYNQYIGQSKHLQYAILIKREFDKNSKFGSKIYAVTINEKELEIK